MVICADYENVPQLSVQTIVFINTSTAIKCRLAWAAQHAHSLGRHTSASNVVCTSNVKKIKASCNIYFISFQNCRCLHVWNKINTKGAWVSEQFLNGTSAHNRPFQCHEGGTAYGDFMWSSKCVGRPNAWHNNWAFTSHLLYFVSNV